MINKKKYLLWLTLLALPFLVNAQQDLTLWYNKPAEKWVEALPIGNGRLGAMIFGGVKQDRIQFNEETLWTGYPRDYNKKGAYEYLDSIRNLLFAGKQKEAEDLAGREFMGLKSAAGDRAAWLEKVRFILWATSNPSVFDFNDASWATMDVPNYDGWEDEGFEGMDGAVWFRTSFELPDTWAGKDLKLDLNRITNQDYTYVNGRPVGSKNNADPRVYTIPNAFLKKGKNVLSVLVINYSGKGGILGYKDTARHIGIYPVDANESQKISLNGKWKYFIQDDDPPATDDFQASYQPFGDVWLNFKIDESKVANYRRSLDLSNAVATTSYNLNGVKYTREYFASAPAQAILMNIKADKKASVSFDIEMATPHRDYKIEKVDDSGLLINVNVAHGALKGTAVMHVSLVKGNLAVNNNKLTISNADEVTVRITAATNYFHYTRLGGASQRKALTQSRKIASVDYQQLKAVHVKEYQQYFNTFSIKFLNKNDLRPLKKNAKGVVVVTGDDLAKAPQLRPTDERLNSFATADDPSFAALYTQYGRYLLISSARPGTRPANLQGIWNDLLAPPWGSKYTTNINAEMNYWPAELLNLSPMHQSLFQMIRELAEAGSETAKQYYNAPGWVLHHNTDVWRGTAPINASNHGIWPTGGAWLTYHLWERYLFTRDRQFLRDTAYPLLKSASEFFNSFLVKDPATGYLISTPSNSPEQGGLVAGPTMDHQIIRALFENTIKASEILDLDADFRKTLQEKYARIAPNKIGKHGQLQEWMQDVDDTTNKHRHVSHLWGVYPGHEINWDETPELMRAARQSLIYRGDEATGWSLGWKINLWARFKDAEHTYRLIRMLLSPARGGAGSYPNLFDAHPPFQIDGNFGGAAGIGELLVQSHAGYLDILPALPAALANGEVKGIKARGGFELDMSWRNGRLQSLTVHSNAGQPLVLRYNKKEIKMSTSERALYKFDGALHRKQ